MSNFDLNLFETTTSGEHNIGTTKTSTHIAADDEEAWDAFATERVGNFAAAAASAVTTATTDTAVASISIKNSSSPSEGILMDWDIFGSTEESDQGNKTNTTNSSTSSEDAEEDDDDDGVDTSEVKETVGGDIYECSEGHIVRPGARFCDECGERLNDSMFSSSSSERSERLKKTKKRKDEEDDGDEIEVAEEEQSKYATAEAAAMSARETKRDERKGSLLKRLFSGDDEAARSRTSSSSASSLSNGLIPTQKADLRKAYDVSFKPGPVGIELETDWYGKAKIVKSFKKLSDGRKSPAKKSGQVMIGDSLVSVDGEDVSEKTFVETLDLLSKSLNKTRILRFAPPLPDGLAIEEALNMVHKHKTQFYIPADTEPGELILGYIKRLRGTFVTSFNFYREEDDEFLMAATCAKDCSGDFIFHTLKNSQDLSSIDIIPTNKDSAVYLGRMNQNSIGTELTIHDYRIADQNIKNRSIHELAAVLYERNILGRQPNSMTVLLPRFDESDAVHSQWTSIIHRHQTQEKEKVLRRSSGLKIPFIKAAKGKEDEEGLDTFGGNVGYKAVEVEEAAELIRLMNKKPVWSDDLNAWTLNFEGRVKVASKKNFMHCVDTSKDGLVEEFGEYTTLLRFGKVEKHKFAIDYGFPYSPMTAFAVILSAFAKKLIVT